MARKYQSPVYPEGQPGNNPQQGYYPPPPRKRRKWPWILGILLVIVILLFAGCAVLVGAGGKAVNDAVNSQSAAAEATHTLELKATATGSGTVLYGGSGSTSTESFSGSWSKTVKDVKAKDGYSLTVTSDGTDSSSTVTCKILVDGKEKASEKGSGQMGSASCTLPLDF